MEERSSEPSLVRASGHVVTTNCAVAALNLSGQVVVWGNIRHGGEPSQKVAQQLASTKIKEIYSTHTAFAALTCDCTVVSWGGIDTGTKKRNTQRKTEVETLPRAWEMADSVLGIATTIGAFAAWSATGGVTVWGATWCGGTLNEHVSNRLAHACVQDIAASKGAFASLLDDGSIVAWGSDNHGGDTNEVSVRLKSGRWRQVVASECGFAVQSATKAIVTWGFSNPGSSEVRDRLAGMHAMRCVEKVLSGGPFFAATLVDGSVVTWGTCNCNTGWDQDGNECRWCNDSEAVDRVLYGGITSIVCNRRACAIVTTKGSVVTWGNPNFGGDLEQHVHQQLTSGIRQVCGTNAAFAALRPNGEIVAWGDAQLGGLAPRETQNGGIEELVSNEFAFAARKVDGTAICWGVSQNGGAFDDEVERLLVGVLKIVATQSSFVAITRDGTLVPWGSSSAGGSVKKLEAAIRSLTRPSIADESSCMVPLARKTKSGASAIGNALRSHNALRNSQKPRQSVQQFAGNGKFAKSAKRLLMSNRMTGRQPLQFMANFAESDRDTEDTGWDDGDSGGPLEVDSHGREGTKGFSKERPRRKLVTQSTQVDDHESDSKDPQDHENDSDSSTFELRDEHATIDEERANIGKTYGKPSKDDRRILSLKTNSTHHYQARQRRLRVATLASSIISVQDLGSGSDSNAVDRTETQTVGSFLPFLPCKHPRGTLCQHLAQHGSKTQARPHVAIIPTLPCVEELTYATTKLHQRSDASAMTDKGRVLLPELSPGVASILASIGARVNQCAR